MGKAEVFAWRGGKMPLISYMYKGHFVEIDLFERSRTWSWALTVDGAIRRDGRSSPVRTYKSALSGAKSSARQLIDAM